MSLESDPRRLARELLGRELEDLEPEEQRVLQRVAAGTLIGMDAEELAQAHASVGDRLADRVAAIGGSWGFIIAFGRGPARLGADQQRRPGGHGIPCRSTVIPIIFLNLILSMLAAIQAPIIMMSQNRQAKKDRIAARHDYEVNLRTQLEIIRLSRKIDRIAREIGHVEGQAAEAARDQL